MKLLIIEDNLELREVLTQYLEKERYIVESAADYSTARQKIFDYEYDCILLDITLPDGNGLNLLKEARERNISKNNNPLCKRFCRRQSSWLATWSRRLSS